MKEINEKGGILNRKMEFIHEDTQRKVDLAAYRKAVIEHGCSIIVVEFVSEESMAILNWGAKLFKSHPHIVIAGAAAVDLTKKVIDDYENYKFFFGAMATDIGVVYGYSSSL